VVTKVMGYDYQLIVGYAIYVDDDLIEKIEEKIEENFEDFEDEYNVIFHLSGYGNLMFLDGFTQYNKGTEWHLDLNLDNFSKRNSTIAFEKLKRFLNSKEIEIEDDLLEFKVCLHDPQKYDRTYYNNDKE
jgi:hypothetical protein